MAAAFGANELHSASHLDMCSHLMTFKCCTNPSETTTIFPGFLPYLVPLFVVLLVLPFLLSAHCEAYEITHYKAKQIAANNSGRHFR